MTLRYPKGITKTLTISDNYGEYLMNQDNQTLRYKQILLDEAAISQINEFQQHITLLKRMSFPFTKITASETHRYQRRDQKTTLTLRMAIANHYCLLSDEITRRKASKLPFSLREVLEVARALQGFLNLVNAADSEKLVQALSYLNFDLRKAVIVFSDFTVGICPLAPINRKTFDRSEPVQERQELMQELQDQVYELVVSVLFSGFEEKNYEKLLEEKQNLFEEDINPILTSLLA